MKSLLHSLRMEISCLMSWISAGKLIDTIGWDLLDGDDLVGELVDGLVDAAVGALAEEVQNFEYFLRVGGLLANVVILGTHF